MDAGYIANSINDRYDDIWSGPFDLRVSANELRKLTAELSGIAEGDGNDDKLIDSKKELKGAKELFEKFMNGIPASPFLAKTQKNRSSFEAEGLTERSLNNFLKYANQFADTAENHGKNLIGQLYDVKSQSQDLRNELSELKRNLGKLSNNVPSSEAELESWRSEIDSVNSRIEEITFLLRNIDISTCELKDPNDVYLINLYFPEEGEFSFGFVMLLEGVNLAGGRESYVGQVRDGLFEKAAALVCEPENIDGWKPYLRQ